SENEKDKPEHKSEKDESEGSSPFPVKLRQTNRSKKLYEEKPKDKADKSEKKPIGVTENTKEIIPTKSDAAVSKKSSFTRNRNNNNNNANSQGIIPVSSANSQQENKANTITVKPKEKKSPPKIPVKPKQLLTPKNNSTIKEILPLNQESSTLDKEEQKSSPKSPDKPAWVSLARKRSKKWETPKTDTGNSKQEQEFPIHVDDTPASNNSTTSDQKQVEVPQSPTAKLTSDETPNVVLKVNPPTNPRLQKPALSLEEKPTNPPKPALRSISADVSISKNTAENRRALKTQSCVIPSSKTTTERDPPNWLEVAMQKKKRWLPKEVVDSTIDI
uniref:Uncharacterized protein n=1 Tax=Ciona savignyi TaxID=51511 RepID=H2ZJE0_CIOSA